MLAPTCFEISIFYHDVCWKGGFGQKMEIYKANSGNPGTKNPRSLFGSSCKPPTQIPIGEGNYSQTANNTIPYYSGLVDMIEREYNRPNIPEYPQIAEHIKQALDEVYSGLKEPKQALDDAAVKSAKALGW